jgi:hypothetical protein
MAKLTPICANPFAAEDNPALCPQQMFHSASVKAPLPPDKGGANEINIVINNLLAKLINRLKNQRPNQLFLAPSHSLSMELGCLNPTGMMR